MNSNLKNKKIILVTHNLNFEGAPIVLFELAKILLDFGVLVEVISCNMGNLYPKYKDLGININFAFDKDKYPNYLNDKILSADLVIVNTIVLWKLVEYIQDKVPAIWYIHEAEGVFSNHKFNNNQFTDLICNFENIYTVSEYAKNYIENNYPAQNEKRKIKIIHNFAKDTKELKKIIQSEDEPINITFPASICERKNQIGLITAYKNLPDEYKSKCIIHFAGKLESNKYTTEFLKLIKTEQNIKYHGLVLGDEKSKLYKESDIFCIPSIDDPYPLIGLEAISAYKPIMASCNTGTAGLCEKGAGIVFNPFKTEELTNAIMYMIDNKMQIKEMGIKAREIYEKYATKQQFENEWYKNLTEIFNKPFNRNPVKIKTNKLKLIIDIYKQNLFTGISKYKHLLLYRLTKKPIHKEKFDSKNLILQKNHYILLSLFMA